MKRTSEAVIIDAVRTPVGKYGGVLRSVRPDDLSALVIRSLLERTKIDAALIEDVMWGCANQAGEDNRNVGRMALLLAGLPHHVPGNTINRLCGSSLDAINQAARAIWSEDADILIAGGVESMSRAPYSIPKNFTGEYGNLTAYDTALGWRFPNPKMEQIFPLESMGETAENVAEKYKIKREEQDEFAYNSHVKAVEAIRECRLKEQIVPVDIPFPKETSHAMSEYFLRLMQIFEPEKFKRPEPTEVTTNAGEKYKKLEGIPIKLQTKEVGGKVFLIIEHDEGPRPDTLIEKLAKLTPVFRKNGTVTAGNSSSLNDGAAAMLILSQKKAKLLGMKPIARIVSTGVAGVDPRYMGIGPVPAATRALDKAGVKVSDVGLVELNEAFASQSIAVIRDLNLDPSIVNVNGGAIALGHPLGCTGARIMTTLLHEMKKRKIRYGLATMCIGVGQGIATVVEAVE